MFSLFNGEEKKYETVIEAFFHAMDFHDVTVTTSSQKETTQQGKEVLLVRANIQTQEPQMLIGQSGQNLFAAQHLLKIIFNKKYQGEIQLQLDINHYKDKKVEHLKSQAREMANEVVVSGIPKVLPPMPAYERKIIHTELSSRSDVVVESKEEGQNRHIVIHPQ